MSAQGEFYVEVDAGVVNSGIMPLAGSGGIGEGTEDLIVWLHWRYDDAVAGFTGKSWYWEDPLNPLSTAWGNNPVPGYEATEAGFNEWLRATEPENLDEYLGNWNTADKSQFYMEHLVDLGSYSQGGCIEILPAGQ